MDNRVHDLDQIQEQDGDDQGRRLGTILMASAAIVGLCLALGAVVGRAAEPAAKIDDPLAKLERSNKTPSGSPEAPKLEATAPRVDPANLSFPTALTEDEDRPEVLSALKAAQAEEAALAAPEPKPAEAVALVPPQRAMAVHDDGDSDDDDDLEPVRKTAPVSAPVDVQAPAPDMVASIPAAVAASGTHNLRKAVEHDPLVAAALRGDEGKIAAPHGHDGEFTLQVISNDRPEPSRAFAEALRAKGHAAFVVAADVPDRGRFYRVRIGPFKSRELADAYRHKFEDQEHMNTFVVHDKKDAQ
jgi:cell division septation protein DedD